MMATTLTNMPTGDYILSQVVAVAEAHFPDTYNALLDAEEVSWDDYDVPGYYNKALFLGFGKFDGTLRKVLACLSSDGRVHFFNSGGGGVGRSELITMRRQEPWVFLRDDGPRPDSAKLSALCQCQYYFLASGLAESVKVEKKNWFVAFKVAAKKACDGRGCSTTTTARVLRKWRRLRW